MTQFAFTAAQSNCTWAELAALWDVGDELDVFEIGWVYDHFYPLRTGPEEPTLEGWSTLAMLLARTRRLRGGVLVSGIPFRHPAVLAKTLLAKPASSVTDVGLAVGFSETSSFTAAFRKATGFTPTAFRRSLA